MTQENDNNGFVVKLDGINLSNEAKERIQAGIQASVLKELAAHSLTNGGYPNPDGDDNPHGPHSPFARGVVFIRPRRWYGLIARQLRQVDIANIGGLEKELDVDVKYNI